MQWPAPSDRSLQFTIYSNYTTCNATVHADHRKLELCLVVWETGNFPLLTLSHHASLRPLFSWPHSYFTAFTLTTSTAFLQILWIEAFPLKLHNLILPSINFSSWNDLYCPGFLLCGLNVPKLSEMLVILPTVSAVWDSCPCQENTHTTATMTFLPHRFFFFYLCLSHLVHIQLWV